ncbi:MAG TPA: Chromate resistance protein ChrB [Chloroflexota bacterium]
MTGSDDGTLEWLLLIYTLPSQPTRKRAYVWRELKKLGGVYLRDGVALLPRRPDLEEQLRAVAERIEEYEGTVDLLLSPQFAPGRSQALVARFQEERLAEYRELHHACVRFLRDVLHQVDADDFGFPDVDNLDSELGRLRRWYEQIAARDYFEAPESDRVRDILAKCEEAFERFTSTASSRVDSDDKARDDVFDRLGGVAASEQVPDEYPL